MEQPDNLKLRPIIAGPSCQTHRLSNLLDILLKPFTEFIPSYVRDDLDFLNHLPKHIPKESILVSFDVESLYSSIPHTLGLQAIEYFLDKYPSTIPKRFNKTFILDGIKLILENNIFKFNSTYYKQLKGCAMGTKFAPIYATLTLAFLETSLYSKIKDNYGEEFENQFKKTMEKISR